MSATPNILQTDIDRAVIAVQSATTLQELRCAQSILLPALLGATIEQTAEAIGVSHATVSRLRAAFREPDLAKNSTPKGAWGGRRNAWMSFEEECEFLAPWLAKAEQGRLVVASPIREALAKRLQQPVSASVVYRMLERHDWRKVAPDTRHPKSDPAVQDAWKKKLPEDLDALLKPEITKGRKVRLMFQDEARFGRMVKIRRCWAPSPLRPMVDNGYEREFTYVYGAVSPMEGELDWMICDTMNAERMGEFLAQVSAAHPEEFMVMIVDGASSHVAKALVVPENILLYRLPAYSPQLNPQEHLWDELREKEFPNCVFESMAGVRTQLREGLPRLAGDKAKIIGICAWPWIAGLILNAN